ncbi:MAG: PAS domain S-box protein [Deltaproteobacteria bacterium]|nr:PAS domain S-box protein [Deltaproteobacteria bacterium]
MSKSQKNKACSDMTPPADKLPESKTIAPVFSPLRLIIILALLILICEGLVMFGLSLLPAFSTLFRCLLDPVLLLFVLLPALYFFLFRPMTFQINKHKAVEEKLRHQNAVLSAIRSVNQLITKEKDRDRLLKGACKILIETRGFNSAWIALFNESQVVEMTAEAGLGDNFLPMAELLRQGKLPVCARQALEKPGVVLTEDTISNCADCPLAGTYAGRWVMTTRLEHAENVYGLISLSVPKGFTDYEEEKSLFTEAAGDIASALYKLELEKERTQKEEALRISEERYSTLVEESFDGIFIQKGPKIIFANRRLHEMLGYDEGELVGLDHWQLYHPEYQELTRERALARMRGEDTTTHYEVKMQRKDGSWFYAEIGARVVTIEGEPGIQVWIKDISERKQAEEALRESEERYRAIFDRSLDCVYLHDFEGNFLDANEPALNLLGYDREDIPSLTFSSLLTEDQLSLAFQVLMELKETGQQRKLGEFRVKRKDGQIVYMEAKASVIYRDKRPFAVLGIARDITERKQAEEKLRKSEARLRTVFEASPLGIGLLRKNREIVWPNRTLCRMVGYSSEELHGKNARIFYESDEEFERVGEVISSLGPEKRTADIETRWIRKDGSTFECRIRYALLDPESKDSVVLAMAEDITEERKAEKEKEKLRAQLSQAQKMEAIGTLAGGVAHDFNNILTSIIGHAELALMGMNKNTSHYGHIEEIRVAGHRAAALTRQLLAFSRKELIQPKILNVNHTLVNLEKMLRRLIGEDIELVTAYAPNLWQVKADPGQIEQIIMNLAVNARDAMPKGGKLTIETANVDLNEAYFQEQGVESEEGPYVMLAVTDNGIGMDKETQDRIFEPFFTTKEMGRGTGLGLSTVYGIVKQNKGHIWVYSEEGKGTTFKVYLPRADAEPKEKEEEKSPEHSLAGSETILVAEDDEALRKMAERMLEGYGYKVITAENGKEAMKIAESHDAPIHLLVTDVVMPGVSGRDLAEKLQEKVPEIKVLYMSGYTDNDIAHHGVLEKDVNFIQKPFTREGLATKVREVLDRKKD